MNGIKIQITVFLFMIGIFACASGSKRPRYSDFPLRADVYSIWTKCAGKDYTKVCKNVCTDYTRKNKCKKGKFVVKEMKLKKALDNGYIVLHKTEFFKLLGID